MKLRAENLQVVPENENSKKSERICKKNERKSESNEMQGKESPFRTQKLQKRIRTEKMTCLTISAGEKSRQSRRLQ